MKLLVLTLLSKNKVFAISEYKSHMRQFIIQNEFSKEEYSLEILNNQKKIDKYLVKYQDKYLIEFKDFIIREKDLSIIKSIINKSISNARYTVFALDNINMTSYMTPKDHELIKKCVDLLSEKTKKKNIDEFIGTHQIIRDFFNDHNTRHNLQELNDEYYRKVYLL